MPPSLTDTLTEDETRTLSAAKYEGAPGSLATLASGCGPSHPRSTAHGSRLPAIPAGSCKSVFGHYTP
jgi:hypothetical protein